MLAAIPALLSVHARGSRPSRSPILAVAFVALLVGTGCGAVSDVPVGDGSSSATGSSGDGSSSATGSSGDGSTDGASSGDASSGDASSGDGSSGDGSSGDASSGDGSSDDGSSDDVATRCTGKQGALRGQVRASVRVGATTRNFTYYAPMGLDPDQPVPLILSPHGAGMTSAQMFTLTGFQEIADREGIVLIFPDGNGLDPWNVGLDVSGPGAAVNNALADDQGFIDAIIEFAKADQCIDTKHMFASGFSRGGGYFTNEIACLRSDIAGVAPHSGGTHDLLACPGTRKPVIIFHGDNDLVVPYRDNGLLARERWVWRNGCSAQVDSVQVEGGTCEYHRGCPAHAQVALCHFDGMGHAWAGSSALFIGDSTRASAAELAWSFWRQHAW
jgi:polyhydroxybutyrate depolymerase